MRILKNTSRFVILFTLVFVISGYLLSDDFFFAQLIYTNDIFTPEDALSYVKQNTYFAGDFTSQEPPIAGLTPRYMLTERKYLWCDESAIVLATINDKLGFETRLVDVVGEDNLPHHTYLEVLEDGEWKTYDAVKGKSNLTHRQILEEYKSDNMHGFPQPRPFPGYYHRIIQNNVYLKQLALWIRKIPG